jgi:hypothetical protein
LCHFCHLIVEARPKFDIVIEEAFIESCLFLESIVNGFWKNLKLNEDTGNERPIGIIKYFQRSKGHFISSTGSSNENS